jgi:DNA invertase Pin-like site-specific DNA recombinase
MLVGYMRVSTTEQNLALQRDALKAAGCDRMYEDTCSGALTDRPGLTRALDNLRAGDALVVWKLDRIVRSLGHVVELVAGLHAKGIGLKVLTGGIDTTSSTGRLVFGIFATLAEFERDLILERTMAGLAAARARGRAGGRPRLMTRTKLRTAMAMMADRGNVAADVAEQLGISISTLYAYVNGEGQAKPRARKLLGR